jgi:succinate dehydrogenase / fumarate reductase, membrane anchor subunit
MSLRTPLGTALGSGTARGGVHHWWMQRVTAVALVPLTLWLAYSLLTLRLADHAIVSLWIGAGWHPLLLSLTVLTMAWHSKLGVEVVIEDYVHHKALKTTALLLSQYAHVLTALAAVYAVARIAFRSL